MNLSHLDPSEGLVLYTDGSAWDRDGSGSWAWLVLDASGARVTRSGRVESTTNNRMEIQAWIEGLTAIFVEHGACSVLVFSDSEYVGLGAMDRSRKRHKNKDLWELLDGAVDIHSYVEFCYVKGHSTDKLNKLVDKIAKEARKGVG